MSTAKPAESSLFDAAPASAEGAKPPRAPRKKRVAKSPESETSSETSSEIASDAASGAAPEPAAASGAAPKAEVKPAPEKAPKAEAKPAKPEPAAESAAEAKPAPAEALEDMAKLSENLATAWSLGQEAWARMATGKNPLSPSAVDPFNVMPAWIEFARGVMTRPDKAAQTAMNFWTDYAQLWRQSWMRALGAKPAELAPPKPGDKRFADPVWTENALFDHIKQTYLLASNHLVTAAHSLEGDLDDKERHKVEFFTQRFVEALSPTNFFATNPEALRETLAQRGENLVRGMRNMVKDIERGEGELKITQTDMNAFRLGENIANTPGKVVFRNDVIELIQYEPTTEKVYARPLLISPPWINKFYIMDLDPKKSMVKWLVDQGYTLFMISWKNPVPGGPRLGMEEYIRQGLFAAVDAVLKETGRKSTNVAGYCVGGTMVATALAYMAQTGDSRINAATFFTAQTDFDLAGDLKVFVDEKSLDSLKDKMESEGGVLDAQYMAQSFNMLRSSDLIWSYVISNYMLGKTPFPFDMLYWNSDSTRMPAKLHFNYLRDYYRDNLLSRGKLSVFGQTVNLQDIVNPIYSISTREDHIAPAASVYRGMRKMGGDVRFVLGGSGHIAGVINPPGKNKYQYWTREDGAWPESLELWTQSATETVGSWWPDWDKWLAAQSGEMVAARVPGRKLGVIDEAPGAYVKERA